MNFMKGRGFGKNEGRRETGDGRSEMGDGRSETGKWDNKIVKVDYLKYRTWKEIKLNHNYSSTGGFIGIWVPDSRLLSPVSF